MSLAIWLAAIAALVLLVVLLRRIFSSSSSQTGLRNGDSVLLLGCCASGKTSLFHMLRDGAAIQTVPSIKEKHQRFPVDNHNVSVVDFPGHPRLRTRAQDFYPIARQIIFVIDSSDSAAIRSSAEFIHDIFTNPKINDMNVPILFLCNKSDLTTAKSSALIKQALEKELSHLKNTRATLETEGAEGLEAETIPLGRRGQDFDFSIDSPCEAFFQSCSIQEKRNLDKVVEFIQEA